VLPATTFPAHQGPPRRPQYQLNMPLQSILSEYVRWSSCSEAKPPSTTAPTRILYLHWYGITVRHTSTYHNSCPFRTGRHTRLATLTIASSFAVAAELPCRRTRRASDEQGRVIGFVRRRGKCNRSYSWHNYQYRLPKRGFHLPLGR
jgi:hypothetical protein